MSILNPYDEFSRRPPRARPFSRRLPIAIAKALDAMGPAKSVHCPPAPGKWSPAQIVSHLADCEIAFGFRLRQTLAEDEPIMQPFDQDKWAATYGGIAASQALAAFTAMRAWNLRLIEAALPAAAGPKDHAPRTRNNDFPNHC